MAGRLDHLIVIDVEATCWDGDPPEGQQAEIIEIGVCVVDLRAGKPLSKQSILVRPELSEVSPFCTELTTLTQSQVMQGISFMDACRLLQRKYRTRDRVWASYGDYDRRQFEKQCRDRSVDYPFGPTHVNVKSLVAVLHGWQREVGLVESLHLLRLPLAGTHHRGMDDAWNTGVIFSTLVQRHRDPEDDSQNGHEE